MRKINLLIAACLMPLISLYGQTVKDYTVGLGATVSVAPAQIELTWTPDPAATGYTVYRKQVSGNVWGILASGLPGTDSAYTDTSVAIGEAWEYRVYKTASGYNGNGYIYAGIQYPETESRGKIILVVDSSMGAGLGAEIGRLTEDLWGDGWIPVRLDVDRNDPVDSVKSRIKSLYQSDPSNYKAVFLLGHVPVPYSGNIYPDGHTDHQGAWPADVYYGEMNSIWTDISVNNTSASRTANHNVPGDGKFDASAIPSDLEMQVGRVDMANLPAFSLSEENLLRAYLDKDHAWRQGEISVPRTGIVDDNFGVFSGEIFAANGWRNFAPLVGDANVSAADFRTTLNNTGSLWAYGCGAGSYTSASGVGTTTNFTTDSLKGIFSMIFGSYHGDWDATNNVMRAALANQGTVLSCSWAGRPHWQYHHMGLGETIGFSAFKSQNNSNTYFSSYFPRFIHIALLGDPSLRQDVVRPVGELTVTAVQNGRDQLLSWTPSPDATDGYHVYRQDSLNGAYTRLNAVALTDTFFTDTCVAAGDYRYMVRARKLEVVTSGSYFNLSQGVFDTITAAPVHAVQLLILNTATLCEGDSISADFSVQTDFCPGNVYNMELSDGSGSFAAPQIIGSQAGETGGTIWGQVPMGLPAGAGYRVRITADQPGAISNDNGQDLLSLPAPVAGISFTQFGDSILFWTNAANLNTLNWDFGDGNSSALDTVTHVYTGAGSYTISLAVSNICGSDTTDTTIVIVGLAEAGAPGLELWPNPADDEVRVRYEAASGEAVKIRLWSLQGRLIREWEENGGDTARLSLNGVEQGLYLLEVTAGQRSSYRKLMVQ